MKGQKCLRKTATVRLTMYRAAKRAKKTCMCYELKNQVSLMVVIGSWIKEIAQAVATVTGKKLKQGISITMPMVLLTVRVLAVLGGGKRCNCRHTVSAMLNHIINSNVSSTFSVYFSGYKGTSDYDIDTYVQEVVIHTMRNYMIASGGRPSKQPKGSEQ